jgi:hypothetical protein
VSGYIVRPIALLMTDFDLDGDRRVTRDELAAGVEASWRDADADGDGATSAFEFADWARLVMGSESAIPGRVAFDVNVDSAVSRAEFVQTLSEEFARLDADENEILERSELVRFIEPVMQRGGGQARPGGEGGAPPPRSTAAE